MMATLVQATGSYIYHNAVRDRQGNIVGVRCQPSKLPDEYRTFDGKDANCHRCRNK